MTRPYAPSERAPCTKCGRVRAVNRRRDHGLCQDCAGMALVPCPDCPRLISRLGMGSHRRWHAQQPAGGPDG